MKRKKKKPTSLELSICEIILQKWKINKNFLIKIKKGFIASKPALQKNVRRQSLERDKIAQIWIYINYEKASKKELVKVK